MSLGDQFDIAFNQTYDHINQQVETYMLASTAQDRNIVLYDCRENNPLRKVILSQKTNQIAFNPMEAFNFTAACDDNNLYSFDMRKLSSPLNVHMGHAMAVLCVGFSPTGIHLVLCCKFEISSCVLFVRNLNLPLSCFIVTTIPPIAVPYNSPYFDFMRMQPRKKHCFPPCWPYII